MTSSDDGGSSTGRQLDDESARRIYTEILAAVREGIQRRDPILMVLVDPDLFLEFHAWWDSWDFKIDRGDDVLDAKGFITIAESDHPLGDDIYELVSRSDNELNFLYRHYRDFVEHMKGSPVQIRADDLRLLFVREKFEEFVRKQEEAEGREPA